MQLVPQVVLALNTLQAQGFDTYLVGGCVRDYLMDLPINDFDITTAAKPEQVKAAFVGYTVVETGIKHGTVTVIVDGLPLEITTFRRDGDYTDNRRPDSVTYSDCLREDLARRDFTMNALAYSPNAGVQDFYGGREDINSRIVRAVGDAEQRFQEDALRILRGLRFAAVLGFEIEAHTAAAMHSQKELLKNISGERIFIELKKLLCGSQAAKIVAGYLDVLGVVLPELLPMQGFAQHNPYHSYDVLTHTLKAVEQIEPLPHLRLAALLHDVGKPRTFTRSVDGVGHFYGHMHASCEIAGEILSRLRVDNHTRAKVLKLVKYHDVQIIAEEKYVKRWLHKLGVEDFFELLRLKRSDMIAQKGDVNDPRQAGLLELQRIAEEILSSGSAFNLKDLAVTGRELIEIGIPQGKDLGIILNKLLELVMEGELVNRREDLIKYVKENFY